MTNESATIVQRLWNYCNVLRDDVSCGDYVEQLTYLLFLKMADEQTKPPFRKPSIIPEDYAWPALTSRDGGDLESHYRQTLIELGQSKGMLGVIFRKAQNRIQHPHSIPPTPFSVFKKFSASVIQTVSAFVRAWHEAF